MKRPRRSRPGRAILALASLILMGYAAHLVRWKGPLRVQLGLIPRSVAPESFQKVAEAVQDLQVQSEADARLHIQPLLPSIPGYCPPRSQSADVIIVTAETNPLPGEPSMDNFRSIMAVNQHYWAETQGYAFLRIVYPPGNDVSSTCNHTVHGSRHASWCKLLAVRLAMRCVGSNSLVFWMDSDSMAVNVSHQVRKLIEAAPTGRISHKTCYSKECMEFKNAACLLTTANFPSETENAMAAMFFLKNNDCGSRVLRAWWNVGICSKEFPWEQRALNSVLYPASYHNASNLRISQMAYGPNHYNESEPFVHFGHTFSPLDRLNLTQKAMRRLFQSGPSPALFASWHDVARRSEVDLSLELMQETSKELAAGGDGWYLAEWLDSERRTKYLARECFWAIFVPTWMGKVP